MTIKGILFDAADVFYKRDETAASLARRLLNERGYLSELAADDEERRQELHHQASGGYISAATYWDEVLKLSGVALPDVRAAIAEQIMVHANKVHALPGARETVKTLKQRGFSLGIVTDTIYPLEWKMNWLNQVGVAEFMDVIACSSELGVHKPDPAIYLNAIRKANLSVKASAFVGHDASEIEGARKVGLKTVAVMYDPHARADYYASTLVELLDVPIFQAAQ